MRSRSMAVIFLLAGGCSDNAPRLDLLVDAGKRDMSSATDTLFLEKLAADIAADQTAADGKRPPDLVPPFCQDLHCCITKTCSLSDPSPCLDDCSKSLATNWKVVYLLWWACAFCAANCSGDKNCAGKSSCNRCVAECQSNAGNIGSSPACTSCVEKTCASAAAACPGLQAALSGGCP
jgi:hypothetical protein